MHITAPVPARTQVNMKLSISNTTNVDIHKAPLQVRFQFQWFSGEQQTYKQHSSSWDRQWCLVKNAAEALIYH